MNEDRQELTLQEQKHLVAVDSMDEVIRLFGVFDENLKVIEEETGAVIKSQPDRAGDPGAGFDRSYCCFWDRNDKSRKFRKSL